MVLLQFLDVMAWENRAQTIASILRVSFCTLDSALQHLVATFVRVLATLMQTVQEIFLVSNEPLMNPFLIASVVA